MMCPPSNCPTGRRFKAVTNNPTQPAKAMGCRIISWPSGRCPNIIFSISENNMELPRGITGPSISEITATFDNLSPIIIVGIVRTKPTKGPAIPMSNKALRLGIIPFILITAPKVPKGERGKGIKKGRVTSTPYLLLIKK